MVVVMKALVMLRRDERRCVCRVKYYTLILLTLLILVPCAGLAIVQVCAGFVTMLNCYDA
jgi:hypothetical protein